jgi:uncharacterized membrane protein YgaE (UPF0421/DUF939 family)
MKTIIKLNKYTNHTILVFGGILIGIFIYAMVGAGNDVESYKNKIKQQAENERYNVSTYQQEWNREDKKVVKLKEKLNKAIQDRDVWSNRGNIAKQNIDH